jgi:cellulose synthase/poly-beta-1,6-N-acetylglucosamine synthase-like glycosyltransferase
LATNALEQAAGDHAFGDPQVGAAQVTVWMKNRNDKSVAGGWFRSRFSRYLVRMQDLEFRTIIAGMQSLRTATGTVGLGGNGQFTRLAVLDEIGRLYGEPWHGSLLEDYELGVHVLLAGHQIRHLHDTRVEQEGLVDLQRFLTQRTRWAQGNIQCAKYLRDIIGSRHFDGSGVIESSYYLLLPFLQLVGFATWIVLAFVIGGRILDYPGGLGEVLSDNWGLLIVFVIIGIGPFAVWGPVYQARCERDAPWYMGIVWGLGQWIYSFYTWITAPRAFFRVIRRKQGWAKTRRNGERTVIGVVAKES